MSISREMQSIALDEVLLICFGPCRDHGKSTTLRDWGGALSPNDVSESIRGPKEEGGCERLQVGPIRQLRSPCTSLLLPPVQSTMDAIHSSQWYFSLEQLQNTPSSCSLLKELYDRARGIEFLFRLGSSLQLYVCSHGLSMPSSYIAISGRRPLCVPLQHGSIGSI